MSFRGGPCNGKVAEYSDAQLSSGVTSCGGIQYTIVGTSPGLYTAIPSSQAVETGGSPAAMFADLLSGWDDLKHSLTRRLWPALNAGRRNNQLALQALARRHRVKGR